jgi:hypothetical protein
MSAHLVKKLLRAADLDESATAARSKPSKTTGASKRKRRALQENDAAPAASRQAILASRLRQRLALDGSSRNDRPTTNETVSRRRRTREHAVQTKTQAAARTVVVTNSRASFAQQTLPERTYDKKVDEKNKESKRLRKVANMLNQRSQARKR